MNHKNSKFRILSECKHGYIGVCKCCQEFNFAYKTILVSFQEDEMLRFFDWLISKRHSPEHYMPLHNGRNRVYASQHSNLFIAFRDKELDEIETMYNEMKIIRDTQRILLSDNET